MDFSFQALAFFVLGALATYIVSVWRKRCRESALDIPLHGRIDEGEDRTLAFRPALWFRHGASALRSQRELAHVGGSGNRLRVVRSPAFLTRFRRRSRHLKIEMGRDADFLGMFCVNTRDK